MTILECFAQAMLLLHITAPPALAMDMDEIKVTIPGQGTVYLQAGYDYSTIMLTKKADCGHVMHEMKHHQQFLREGQTPTDADWYIREHEAARFEMGWRGNE